MVQSDESIENLVLEEDEMRTLKDLSRRQNSKRETWAADFIEGKGTGQIILLHGPPGVRKTYTVEAIAEYLHRPLISLTITDIGTVETKVEQELIKWFTLAEAWNAVLLVNEADIFLERRQNRDLARNGFGSAFLRRMEYFKGLLFLTTNRVGQIDDAFISRVHVAIGYNALSPKDRTKIWEGFFRKLAKERAGKIQISPGAKKWVLEKAMTGEAQLNGREIRNALQTAITLAEAECEEDPDFDVETMCIIVDKTHFQRVLDINNKFQSYVQSIRREDEKKRAAGRYDRNDYFKGEIE
ncbi:atpase aaa+ type core protein [Apiospora saccharicola]